MNITISNNLSTLYPNIALLVVHYTVDVKKSTDDFLLLMDEKIAELQNLYTISDIVEIENIKNTRTAYKAFGKSPSSYRNAAEAMLRRIAKGNGLYRVNNVVDINNYVSISSGFSIGSYNAEQLVGDITLQHAAIGENYQGIGKDILNIEKLPILYDEHGAFGNPTSDSQKAMITPDAHEVISVVYSFSGDKALDQISEQFTQLLINYCNAEIIETQTILPAN